MWNAIRFYNRFGRMMFKIQDAYPIESANSCVYRSTKLMNSFAQLSLAIALAVGIGTMKSSQSGSVWGAFIIMRIVSPLFTITESKVSSSSKMASLICYIFYLIVFIVA